MIEQISLLVRCSVPACVLLWIKAFRLRRVIWLLQQYIVQCVMKTSQFSYCLIIVFLCISNTVLVITRHLLDVICMFISLCLWNIHLSLSVKQRTITAKWLKSSTDMWYVRDQSLSVNHCSLLIKLMITCIEWVFKYRCSDKVKGSVIFDLVIFITS